MGFLLICVIGVTSQEIGTGAVRSQVMHILERTADSIRRSLPTEFVSSAPNDGTGEARQVLLPMGPNILPDLMAFLANTTEDKTFEAEALRSFVARLVIDIGSFTVYQYRSQQNKTGLIPFHFRPEMLDTDERSIPVLKYDESGNELWDDALIRWWGQRDTFLKRTDVLDKIRRIVGRTEEEYAEYDLSRYRQLIKYVYVYGIYNLPYFVQIIAEDNNPCVFAEFLERQCGGRAVVVAGDPVGGWNATIERIQKEYPRSSDKLATIRDWWIRVRSTYTELPDLFSAIDAQVSKHCAEAAVR